MLYFKSCPKCNGDMYLDRDAYGSFRQCLQCGNLQDLVEKAAILPAAPVTAKPKRLRQPSAAPSRAVA